MKKLFNLLTVLFAGVFIASASPSLDGRAIVAESGVLPSGLFAKTVGYLPGDSINITNPSNGQTIEILVIGSLDPSEGVAVLLSPEAAQSLNIKKNSNMLVKLTKRSGELDENSNGSCILTQSNAATAPVDNEDDADEKSEPLEDEVSETENTEEESVPEVEETEIEEIDKVSDEDSTEECSWSLQSKVRW